MLSFAQLRQLIPYFGDGLLQSIEIKTTTTTTDTRVMELEKNPARSVAKTVGYEAAIDVFSIHAFT